MPAALKSDAQRRRRNATLPMTRLPSEGRKGKLPVWPLSEMATGEEALWVSLWSMPQAVIWERQHLHRIVARYCRITVEAEKPEAKVTLAGECRQLEDRLLLNPDKLKRAHYEIADDELAEKRESNAKPKRARLAAVDPAAS